ncbi:MAG: hypothetical protein SVT56_11120 [Chloroflexota bacterium]|nr:hypothetical protein [Chloroflexota bacterium]
MKRNLHFILLLLFILPACQPSPKEQGHASTDCDADDNRNRKTYSNHAAYVVHPYTRVD